MIEAYFTRFLKVLRELGIPMKVVDGDAFHAALRQTLKDKGREYIYEAFRTSPCCPPSPPITTRASMNS